MEERVHGTTMPVLELTLQPNEAIISESGELSWMTSSIVMRTSTGMAGGGRGVLGALKRGISGASIFMTEYSAQQRPGVVAFATHLPGQIFPLDVNPAPGQQFIGHKHAFLCATSGVQLNLTRLKFGAGVLGGNGFWQQHISGQGRVWVELSGEVVTYDLRQGETLRVHPGHVGLFQDTVSFDITTIPGIRNKFFGGDGIFLAALTGPGRVWLQSLTLPRLAHALQPYIVGETGEQAAGVGVGAAVMRGILKG